MNMLHFQSTLPRRGIFYQITAIILHVMICIGIFYQKTSIILHVMICMVYQDTKKLDCSATCILHQSYFSRAGIWKQELGIANSNHDYLSLSAKHFPLQIKIHPSYLMCIFLTCFQVIFLQQGCAFMFASWLSFQAVQNC